MELHQAHSVCRICVGSCGVVLTIDENEQLVKIEPDKTHPMSKGHICFKGLQTDPFVGPTRLLHPLKRQPDGSFQRIGLEQALNEIADKLRIILERDGPDAIGVFDGTVAYPNVPSMQMLYDWMPAIGIQNHFATMTIDQPAKYLTPLRLGYWAGGRQPFDTSEVIMAIGGNPIVTHSVAGMPFQEPANALKKAKARGLKLIVIDPRRTETAHYADVFLQPYPGEDPTVAAGLLSIILNEGWEDKEFCAQHVHDLDGLRRAVEPFSPEYVEKRAGVPREKLREAAELFARRCRRGAACTSTGSSMSPHSSLSDHLYECLNVVCGRFLREGERILNPGVMSPYQPRRAQVVAPDRSWETGRKSRIRGVGMMFGEMMTGIMADEILLPGKGQVKALMVDGANPVNCVPDREKIIKALKSLELMVCVDPYMTPSAQLAHYILPPKVNYEYANTFPMRFEDIRFSAPFAQLTPALVKPPAGAEVVDSWYIYWALARRLGRTIVFSGVPLDMSTPPSTEDLLAIMMRNSQVSFEELKQYPQGKIFDLEPQYVEPCDPASSSRFEVIPQDIRTELAQVAAEKWQADGSSFEYGQSFTHRLTCRRMRNVLNTMNFIPSVRHHVPFNPAHLHPQDMAKLGLQPNDRVEIVSSHGRIPAIVVADDKLRSGVVSMTHGWGGLPNDKENYANGGSSINQLISTDRDYDSITAIPRMSAIPVNILKVA